jgi:hypothetical protein
MSGWLSQYDDANHYQKQSKRLLFGSEAPEISRTSLRPTDVPFLGGSVRNKAHLTIENRCSAAPLLRTSAPPHLRTSAHEQGQPFAMRESIAKESLVLAFY